MKLSFIKNLYDNDLITIHESFDSWQEAVKASVVPLVKKDIVTPAYGEEIIKYIDNYGLYIFLCPHVCMPHCNAFSEVKQSGICFMKVNKAVYPDPEDDSMFAELFFAIAGADPGEHIQCIQDLMEVLEDEETFNALLAVKTMDDIKNLIYNQESN